MNFWQRKLLAFLHDPPHKLVVLYGNTGSNAALMAILGFWQKETGAFSCPVLFTPSIQ
jgi:hypothetical protein